MVIAAKTAVVADPLYGAAQVADMWGLPVGWHGVEPHDPETWRGIDFEGWRVFWYQEDRRHPPIPLGREAAGKFHRFLRDTSRTWAVD